MSALPEPDFIDRDPEAITREVVATLEEALGRKLQPAQIERLIADVHAYREVLVRIAIQEGAKQNLVAYARYPMLDHLGELVGVARLAPQAARTTLRFTLSALQAVDVVIPAGTRVRAKDRAVAFATDEQLVIAAGATEGEIGATATTTGEAANGYLQGEVATLMDPVPTVDSVTNATVTNGGADTEDDERLRARIRQAPHMFSVAGPVNAYRARVMEAHQDIIDVAVLNPAPGEIEIRPLTVDGLPTAEMLTTVASHLSQETIRPLGDQVTVLAPEAVNIVVDASVTAYDGADTAEVQAAVEQALNDVLTTWRQALGRDVVPSQLAAAASAVAGVYDVTVNAPAKQVLAVHQVAISGGITVTVAGVADG